MKTIYFVRHGETESNAADRVSGSGVDTILTTVGREQARKTGEELKKRGVQLIVCSPMKRAVETAMIIAEQVGYDPAEIIQDSRLIERDYGIYEDVPGELLRRDLLDDRVHESAESTEQMHARFSAVLDWLKSLEAEKIVVVSHNGGGRAYRVINSGLHHSHMYKLEPMQNAGIYKFEL